VWNGHAGWRVQIGSTPRWSALVGVVIEMSLSPTRGTAGSCSGGFAVTVVSADAPLASTLMRHEPGDVNVATSGKYGRGMSLSWRCTSTAGPSSPPSAP
jgi:hypothetical protein